MDADAAESVEWISETFAVERGKMVSYLVGKRVDRAEAEDMADEVFCRAWDALVRGKGPCTNPKGWLWQILRNLHIDRSRVWKRMPRIVNAESVAEDGCEDRGIMRVEAAHVVGVALRMLTPSQYEALRLMYVDGCSLRETAELMGNTEGGIKSLRRHGLEKMRSVVCGRD